MSSFDCVLRKKRKYMWLLNKWLIMKTDAENVAKLYGYKI